MKKDFRILLDLDDTITDFLPDIVKEYNDFFGEEHSLDEITEWVIPNTFKHGLLEMTDRTDFLTRVSPKAGAIKYINKWLDEGYDIYIVSDCRTVKDYEDKVVWLKTFLPKFDINKFISCRDKFIIQGDIFIDDRIENVDNWEKKNEFGHGLIFEAKHNENIIDERKVVSFAEIDGYIKVVEVLNSFGNKMKSFR